jgi:hypothetical protein
MRRRDRDPIYKTAILEVVPATTLNMRVITAPPLRGGRPAVEKLGNGGDKLRRP